MTEISYPQDGLLLGDATAAPYDADEFALHVMGNQAGFARRADYGPVKGYDDGTHYGLEVTQTSIASANVLLRPGSAMVTGTVYENTTDLTLAVGANASGNARIDTVIIRKDFVLQTIRAAVLQGSPAATPVPPTLTQDATTWEIPIANIAVANGFSTLTDSNITNRQQWVNVGDGVYIDGVFNNSGGALDDGDIVVWSNAGTKYITTTTTANNGAVAGAVVGRIESASYGRIQVKGLKKIRISSTSVLTTSLPIGTLMVSSATAKRSQPLDGKASPILSNLPSSTNSPAIIGQLAESFAFSGNFDTYALVYLNCQKLRPPLLTRIWGVGGSATGNFTSGSWVTRVLNSLQFGTTFQWISTTIETNPFVGLSSNQITLQPGIYIIKARAPGYRCAGHQIRLLDTATASVIVYGSVAYSPSAADSSQTYSELEWSGYLTAARTFELQHQCETTRATDGLGRPITGFVTDNIYSVVEITRTGEALL